VSTPVKWRNLSPGDLDTVLPEIEASNVDEAVGSALRAFPAWAGTPLEERIEQLSACREALRDQSGAMIDRIVAETGKRIVEARGEFDAVLAKFDFVFADAREVVDGRLVTGGPFPAVVRLRPRGPAAVVSPFNFPLHLGHGATLAYLLAGNTVVLKPSPLAAWTVAAYFDVFKTLLPAGVLELVQGGAAEGAALCGDPRVRSVCFTGSIAAGHAIAASIAGDHGKVLSLELGGKNATFVFADADPVVAAKGVAESVCLGAGQRCNATSWVAVERSGFEEFALALTHAMTPYVPGIPQMEDTLLGPLINQAAVDRFVGACRAEDCKWRVHGQVVGNVDGRRGNYVTPAIAEFADCRAYQASPLSRNEIFAPLVALVPFNDPCEPVTTFNALGFGLTASIYTASRSRFETVGSTLRVGNLYHGIPTTFSPSTLPFGGVGLSGNGHPGGRGFIRFAGDEQAVQTAT